MKKYAEMIKKIYIKKDYHLANVTYKLEEDKDGAIAKFYIDENKKIHVKRIRFTGNKYVSGKKLRSIMFSKEDWPLSFINKAGSYQPDMLEFDKYTIENFYQNNGFLHAKVTSAKVDLNESKKQST